jgi:hypothetical protein
VLLTEAELASLRALSESAGVSVQRYLIEAAMSGSADDAASRRRAVVDVQASRVVLKGVSNNLNQLTKWANRLDSLVDDLAQAVATVEQTASELRTAFGLNQQSRGGEEGRASS